MEFIRTLREKSQTQRQATIERQAEDMITLSDFNNELFIAYGGTPFIPIDASWTSKEIVEELSKLRNNFVNSRMKEVGLTRIAAAL